MNDLLYFLPAIILLGLVTSYEDIKFGQVRNKWIALALGYAVVVYSLLIAYSYLGEGISQHYPVELFTNMSFVIILGFGMWYFGIWTAGDGKLFIAFSALLPLSVYIIGYQKFIPSITLLINVFIPALLLMIIFMLFRINKKDIKKVLKSILKEFFQPKSLLDSAIYLFAIFWVIQILLSLIGLSSNYVISMLLTMLVFAGIRKKLGKKALQATIAVSIARLLIDGSVYSVSFLIDFLVLIFVWKLIRSFFYGGISKLAMEAFSREVKVKDLKPGMILSEIIQKKGKKELKALEKLPDVTIIKHNGKYFIRKPKSALEQDNFIEEEAEGLTMDQIDKIRGIGIKNIRVSQTIPFAPFIFLGVILTIIAKGNILIVVMNML